MRARSLLGSKLQKALREGIHEPSNVVAALLEIEGYGRIVTNYGTSYEDFQEVAKQENVAGYAASAKKHGVAQTAARTVTTN